MTLIANLLKDKTPTEHSDCNAWGFRGWSGKLYKFKSGLQFERGQKFYRHDPSSKIERWKFKVTYAKDQVGLFKCNNKPYSEDNVFTHGWYDPYMEKGTEYKMFFGVFHDLGEDIFSRPMFKGAKVIESTTIDKPFI
jgi:hypothetical protein